MVMSNLTTEDVANFLRLDDASDPFLAHVLSGAKEYVIGYTGLTEGELDGLADIPLAVLVLCQDMYDHRSMYADKSNVNRTIESILNRYRVNLV